MNAYNVDFAKMTITITADFAKRMNNPNSEEYKTICRFRKDFPAMRIVNRTHHTPRKYVSSSTGEKFNCNQFKNLTYERMERFISALPKSEEYQREYNFVKNYASAVQHNGYTLVRKWFVKQFPEFRKNPLLYLSNSPALLTGTAFLGAETIKNDVQEFDKAS